VVVATIKSKLEKNLIFISYHPQLTQPDGYPQKRCRSFYEHLRHDQYYPERRLLLFAATLLRARKLIELDSDRPSSAKVAAVENAISQAAFILECIDRKWPEK
jgi:hypothetical protein